MKRLYDWMLWIFPEKDYDAHRSRPWGWFFRFDICDEDTQDLYLRRFVLLRCPWGSVYLHHIVRSDRDRCLHDHPWNAFIVVLWGGYRERLDGEQTVFRRPGSIRWMPAKTRHRVLLWSRLDTTEIPAWTLCIVGKKVRDWGFWQKGQWVQWKQFLSGNREC